MNSIGLIDLQINGFAGIDFNSGALTPDELDHALEAVLRTGVTTILPTLITAMPGELEQRFDALDRAVRTSRLGPLMCPGYHLEGPFLNPADGFRGCHPPEAMTAADPALVEYLAARLSRPIIMVTCAPEMTGGMAFVRAMKKAGRIVAIGHSSASFADVTAAADAGLCMSTHLGNGIGANGHKFNNPIMAQLAEDRLWAGIIADGIHVPPSVVKVLVRARGLGRSVLVTDAVSAAAVPSGLYPFAGMRIEKTADGTVRVPNAANLAGSSLCLDEAIRNVMAWGVCSFSEALQMAANNPARLLAEHGVPVMLGSIEWSDDLQVRSVRLETACHTSSRMERIFHGCGSLGRNLPAKAE